MESKLAKEAERALVEATQRLSPEERLNAFQGTRLQFIGREDFIAMKVFAGGPMDIIDASRAIAAARESLDLELLSRLAEKYGRDAVQALGRLLPT